ncbi:hypothetical protein HYW44_04505 [Candidatus Daviesbacteria bacterium]|nr:hypothetical protein [Candidatus Daviesbacteria bacterium]
MVRHILTLSVSETDEIISGTKQFIFKFFKKRPVFLSNVNSGDLVYFKINKGEVLGQFEIGKLIVAQKLEAGDWNWIKEIGKPAEFGLTKSEFEEKANMDKTLVIVQIIKLEQFITPPIEIDKRSKKEWIVLD